MADEERTKGGQPIYRHKESQDGWTAPVYGDEGQEEAISDHIAKYFGKPSQVLHEILSDLVHIDVHIINPTKERNYYTLFTTGMSYLPMSAPEEYKHLAHAELIMHLPPDWDIESKEEKYFWPIRWLKFLTRFPHEYKTWIFYGHTIPTNEDAEPFNDSTDLGCMILSGTRMLDEDQEDEFVEMEFNGKKIFCLTMLPIYKEEMNFKLDTGANALFEKLSAFGIDDIISPTRKNVCLE